MKIKAKTLPGVRIHDEDAIHIAGLLTLVGPPESPEGIEAFNSLTGLLLHPRRLPRLRQALNLIPPDPGAILSVCRAISYYARVSGKDPSRERIRLDVVIQGILSIPSPEDYIRIQVRQDFTNLGGIFHENTIAAAKKDPKFRGIFSGTLGTPENPGYREKARGHVRVIRDDD